MIRKNCFRIIILSSFCLFIFSSAALADVYIRKIRQTENSSSVVEKSQKPVDEKGVTWLTKDKMREDMGNASIIVRLDQKKIYMNIDHESKTYSEINLPIDMENLIPPEAKQLAQLIERAHTFKETGELMKIRDWNCKKYLVEIAVSMMGMNMPISIIIWASKDLGVDLSDYLKLQGEILSTNPFTKDISKDFKRIEGFPVVIEFAMAMPSLESRYREEVVSVERKKAPDGTYDLPQGYTKIPYNPFGLTSPEKE